ncbi:MAG: hypothetical protein LBV79_00600 [Candidatus Adiutrix sp.]|jgi:hypothetical protein|nr:hypothetical protein [Candidatus Adiutrix sp.]
MKLKILMILFAAALMLAGPLPAGHAAEPALVGEVPVRLSAPQGLTRVDGRHAGADAYIASVAKKFRMTVLAVYARPAEWDKFVAEAGAGRPASIPQYAMILTTAKMATKKFSDRDARREFKRFDNLFTLTANNRPMAALLTSKGNAKLKERMGVDIGFVFNIGPQTKKIADSSRSISFGAEVDFNVFGKPSAVYLTTAALQVSDKLVFLSFFENREAGRSFADIQGRAEAWRAAMSSANAGK